MRRRRGDGRVYCQRTGHPGRDHAGFIAEIEAALADPGPKPERSALVKTESWEARVDTIRGHVAALR